MSISDPTSPNNVSTPALSPDETSQLDIIFSSQVPLLVVNIVLMPFMLAILLMRLYVRRNLVHNLGWDDHTCILAAFGAIIHLSLIIASFSMRAANSDNTNSAILLDPQFTRLNNATQIVYPFVMYTVKLSILLLYKRIFRITRWMKMTINTGIVFMALLYINYLFFAILTTIQCTNVITSNTFPVCEHMFEFLLSLEILNEVTNILILVLPFRTISKLQLKKRQKRGIIAIFSIGLIPCCASLSRCGLLISTRGIDALLWNNGLGPSFATVEIIVAIITACAPTLPTFLAHVRPRIRRLFRSCLPKSSPEVGTVQLHTSKEDLLPDGKPALQVVSTDINLRDQSLPMDRKSSGLVVSP